MPEPTVMNFRIVGPSYEVLEEIAELEQAIQEVVTELMHSKLTFAHTKSLKYVPDYVVRAVAEHAIVTNTLKHVLHKARDERIRAIKRGD